MNQKIIYLENIKKNLEYFSSFNKELVIMVKANAYGHGLEQIAKLLTPFDVCLGVASLQEANDLNRFWNGKIFIAQPLKCFEGIKENYYFSIEDISSFFVAQKLNLLEKCYIKINTGMNRYGFKYNDKMLKKIGKITKKTKIKGLMTHFFCLEDQKNTYMQYERFLKVKKYFCDEIEVSFGGSNVCFYDFDFTQLRIGIGFYGYENKNVLPIMKIKSVILNIKTLQEGEGLGYGYMFIAKNKCKIATIGLGYGDGLSRNLTGFYVKVNGFKCKIVGNICMDCMFVDVSGVLCHEGDEVILESADLTAKHLNTISYEVLTSYSKLRGEYEIYE